MFPILKKTLLEIFAASSHKSVPQDLVPANEKQKIGNTRDHIALRYLTLLKKSLLDELYIENEARLIYVVLCAVSGAAIEEEVIRDIERRRPDIVDRLKQTRQQGEIPFMWDIPQSDGTTRKVNLRNVSETYHTMIGHKRLDNIQSLLDLIVRDNVPGDLIETGVWRGGATIFMRGYLAARGITDRRVWVADSFAGIPVPSAQQDQGLDFSAAVFPILAISRQAVEELFRRYELLDDQVEFLEGWFKDTLPTAPIERLALLRLDGDLYESTRDALTHLYHKLSPGGFVIVDDYFDFQPCRQAVDEFRENVGDQAALQRIDWTAVYWRKGVVKKSSS
jgi:O-methyltransferase